LPVELPDFKLRRGGIGKEKKNKFGDVYGIEACKEVRKKIPPWEEKREGGREREMLRVTFTVLQMSAGCREMAEPSLACLGEIQRDMRTNPGPSHPIISLWHLVPINIEEI